MRLLHITSLSFSEHISPSSAPPYIIASHRWLKEEVSYQDFLQYRSSDKEPNSKWSDGLVKILGFCAYIEDWRTADQDIPEYLWIDTCCINKDSSAELQEAITSMFAWYAEAWCCLAWMQDVQRSDLLPPVELLNEFAKGVWFTRGWTLQELLAPRTVIFLDACLRPFGYKSHASRLQTPTASQVIKADLLGILLNHHISKVTGIDELILWDYNYAKSASIEDRLAWMERRQTLREEDRAYCMLGICELFMPLVYGEGRNAMKRLERKARKQTVVSVELDDNGKKQRLRDIIRGLIEHRKGSSSAGSSANLGQEVALADLTVQ